MEIKKVPISEVDVWKKNPRNIRTKDFERLKKQILELGVYKPLVCYEENGKYITLGGNMRLRALRELGLREVEISVVYPKTEAEKIKYSLSDNDRAGEYDEQALAELTYPYIEEINLEDFKVDRGSQESLRQILEEYGPDFKEDEPEVEFTEELLLEHNYIVLYFDNPFDWEVAKEKFKLKKVRQNIEVKNPTIGIGRVINGKEWLERIHD